MAITQRQYIMLQVNDQKQSLRTGVIITDCSDDNAKVRQQSRFQSLFGVTPAFIGLKSSVPDVEAAGNLIDQLDAATNLPGAQQESNSLILVNVAPRGEDIKQKWDNGTPFCFFRVGSALIVSTYEGHCLALARDLGLTDTVQILDLPSVTAAAVSWGEIKESEAIRINNTQFRSLEFLPLVAYWIFTGRAVPSQTRSLHELPAVEGKVWYIDNFGNAKTTILPDSISFREGLKLKLKSGETVPCHTRLTDVPHGSLSLTIGSSGYKNKRFMEVVIQRGNAAKTLNLTIGDQVLT